jgi:hypothetical protein
VGISHRSRYNQFTAADEKIALPVVDVNNKPQYLVFRVHSRHPAQKPPDLPVESAKSSCTASVSGLKSCPIPCAKPDSFGPGSPAGSLSEA